MEKKRMYCYPIIVNKNILSTGDYEFMNKERIKKECDCIYKNTCIRLVEALNSDNYEMGNNLLETIYLSEKSMNK